jgi:hypothetical protein
MPDWPELEEGSDEGEVEEAQDESPDEIFGWEEI